MLWRESISGGTVGLTRSDWKYLRRPHQVVQLLFMDNADLRRSILARTTTSSFARFIHARDSTKKMPAMNPASANRMTINVLFGDERLSGGSAGSTIWIIAPCLASSNLAISSCRAMTLNLAS